MFPSCVNVAFACGIFARCNAYCDVATFAKYRIRYVVCHTFDKWQTYHALSFFVIIIVFSSMYVRTRSCLFAKFVRSFERKREKNGNSCTRKTKKMSKSIQINSFVRFCFFFLVCLEAFFYVSLQRWAVIFEPDCIFLPAFDSFFCSPSDISRPLFSRIARMRSSPMSPMWPRLCTNIARARIVVNKSQKYRYQLPRCHHFRPTF